MTSSQPTKWRFVEVLPNFGCVLIGPRPGTARSQMKEQSPLPNTPAAALRQKKMRRLADIAGCKNQNKRRVSVTRSTKLPCDERLKDARVSHRTAEARCWPEKARSD
jgi:hypothetical protein